MTFCIAGLDIVVDGLRTLPPSMGNLEPFVVDGGRRPEPVCTIECGCTLADADGTPTLENTFDGKMLRLWIMPDGYAASLRFDGSRDTFHLCASHDWRTVQTDCRAGSVSDCMALGDFIMISFIYSAARYGVVLVHASSVAVDGLAAVFIGPSGVGKSTHSRLWLRHVGGSRLLNDDQPALRLMTDGRVCVCGTPWSGKTACYRNECAQLKAVFRMVQAKENKAVRLNGADAFCALLDMTSLMRTDASSFSMISDTVAVIAGKVGVHTLYNRPDSGAVAVSHAVFMQ